MVRRDSAGGTSRDVDREGPVRRSRCHRAPQRRREQVRGADHIPCWGQPTPWSRTGRHPTRCRRELPRRLAVGSNPCRSMASTIPATGSVVSRVAPRTCRPARRPTSTGESPVRMISDNSSDRRSYGPDDSPPTLGGRVHRVDEARPPTPDSWCRRLRHESRFDELGEVLTDCVVVKPEVSGQFDHVDRTTGVDDVAEQLVPGRVTQGSRLGLQHTHRPPTLIAEIAISAITTPAINRFAFQVGCDGITIDAPFRHLPQCPGRRSNRAACARTTRRRPPDHRRGR